MAAHERRGRQGVRRGRWYLLLGLALLQPACSQPPNLEDEEEASHVAHPTTEHETRYLNISVDGKAAGQYRMAITRHPDGRLVMDGKARVRVNFLIFSYSYSYRGTETYKAGRLVRLQSHANDNGKRFAVSTRLDGKHLRLKINGKEHVTRPDLWTTSYWQLPANRAQRQEVFLLDADTGKEMHGTLQYLQDCQLTVGGGQRSCAHYRITGTPSTVDLWYDGQRRLIRQEFVEDGHRTVLELKKIVPGKSAPKHVQSARP